MLDLLLKELCKQIIRQEDYIKITYTINQIFNNHKKEIFTLCKNEELKEKISSLFVYPTIFESIAKYATMVIMIKYDELIDEEMEYIERFL